MIAVDIGREEVLSRWHFPPLSGGADIVAAASNAGPEVGPSSSCPSSSQTHMSCTNGVHAGRVDSVGCGSGEDASAGVAAAAGTSSPYIPPAVLNGTHNNVCNGRDSVMYNSSSSSSSAGVRRQGWSELNRGVDDSADPSAYVPCFPESSSAISSHSFAALIAEEAHEAALLAGLLSGQPQPHLLGGRASGSNSIGFVGELAALEDDSSQSIDSYLQELVRIIIV